MKKINHINTEFYLVWNEKVYLRNTGTIIPTGIIKNKFDTLLFLNGKNKICYCELECNIFFPELKYSLN